MSQKPGRREVPIQIHNLIIAAVQEANRPFIVKMDKTLKALEDARASERLREDAMRLGVAKK